MNRSILLAACITSSAACAPAIDHDAAESVAAAPLLPNEACDYITCGQNTKDIGNATVDQVFFDHTVNDRGQQFVGWQIHGKAITPALRARGLSGIVDGVTISGADLVDSTMTLVDRRGQILWLYIRDARLVVLPNHVAVWTYRIDTSTQGAGQAPLCELFAHTSNDIARYALVATQERIHAAGKFVTAQDPADGKLTLGCPSSATGKMLSLGALRTTAASGHEPTLAEMTATLRALTLSPTGASSYTKKGVPVMFLVRRTRVDNHGEQLSGGSEGYWDEAGAICFDHLRLPDEDRRWALWSETGVPPCSDVDLAGHEILVETTLYLGEYPAYPPPPPPLPLTGSP